MSTKQKIVHGCGPSNLNHGIFVCSFDVCQASCAVLENIQTHTRRVLDIPTEDRRVPKGPNYAGKVKIKTEREIGNSNQNTLHGRDTES